MGRSCALALVLFLLPSCDRAPTASPASWDPRTAEVLLASNKNGKDGKLEIYRVAGETWTNLTQHEASDNWPRWSPDGRRIVFQSQRSGNLDVWVMDADGSNPTQLTDHPASDYLPTWLPDGESISFTSTRREADDPPDAPTEPGQAPKHLYIMRADGTETRRLVEQALGTSAGASWAPDGKTFVSARVVDDRPADLYLTDVATGATTRLTDDPAYCGSPEFSPDGRRIAYYAEDEEQSRIMVIDRDGSNARVVTSGARHYYPRWSPDGAWLMLTAALPAGDDQRLELLVVPATGGEPFAPIPGEARKQEGSWR